MRKLMFAAASAALLSLAFPAGAIEPSGAAMIGVQAARAVKKHKEKMEEHEAESQKLERLRERYPKEVAEYEGLLRSDQYEARRKLSAMVERYKTDTGEDLDKTYAVKKQGLLKKVRERVGGDDSSDDTGASGESRRRGILGRLTGE